MPVDVSYFLCSFAIEPFFRPLKQQRIKSEDMIKIRMKEIKRVIEIVICNEHAPGLGTILNIFIGVSKLRKPLAEICRYD
jgi:hypothetical protein